MYKDKYEMWQSTKYDFAGIGWADATSIFVEELGMDVGQACSALKKSWAAYRIALASKSGAEIKMLQWRINNIQQALGIELSDF
jgi:hypothetical protein